VSEVAQLGRKIVIFSHYAYIKIDELQARNIVKMRLVRDPLPTSLTKNVGSVQPCSYGHLITLIAVVIVLKILGNGSSRIRKDTSLFRRRHLMLVRASKWTGRANWMFRYAMLYTFAIPYRTLLSTGQTMRTKSIFV
jgi:hypothetical protein